MIPLLELYNQPCQAVCAFVLLHLITHQLLTYAVSKMLIPKPKKIPKSFDPTNLGWFSNVRYEDRCRPLLKHENANVDTIAS
jgi:hypothetical protein